MGIKIKSTEGVGVGLLKYGAKTTRAQRRVQAQGAEEIAQVAQEMAPYKTGQLEESVSIGTELDGRRVVKTVNFTGLPYAFKMHESFYNLGPGSLQKSQTSRFMVGRKFLERAAHYVMYEGGLLQRAREAMRKK